MTLFGSFSEKAPNKIFFSMILGVVAGLSYSMLIPIILTTIGSDNGLILEAPREPTEFLFFEVSNHQLALLFVLACLVILVARTASQLLMIHTALDVTASIRLKLYRRIMKAPTHELEKLGSSRILAVLTNDVDAVINGASSIPGLLVNSMTLLGLLSFLLFLNIQVFLIVIAAIVVGGALYQIPMMVAGKYFRKLRENVDKLYDAMCGLIYGSKELKLNHKKRTAYYGDVLVSGEEDVKKSEMQAQTIARVGITFGDLISFFVIGVVTFVLVNYYAISSQTLIGTIMAILYISGPVSIIMNAVPEVIRARVSLKRVNDFTEKMMKEESREDLIALPDWSTIRFQQVAFQYDDAVNNFALGPLDLEINKGEITFVVGGNGSGKSTLSKIMSLHYRPRSGQIYFGNTEVTNDTITSCREAISAIFSDFYLFDRLLGKVDAEQQVKVDNYLQELRIDKKVSVEDGFFSTTSLSDGQKKRLALLVEFIEDKEVYIFDEWAADQDPTFKDVFYHQILPDLKGKGKAVIVISHDDRYFHVADSLITMDEGVIGEAIYQRQADVAVS